MFWINVRLDERASADKIRVHKDSCHHCQSGVFSEIATPRRYWVRAFKTYLDAEKWVHTNLPQHPPIPCGTCRP